ncbi:MAG: hypothetical protein GY696_13955, partial [Gammaproteobacteria bacterium]|nr:hypothetical protein [Gammaproteobacteria bacterium]
MAEGGVGVGTRQEAREDGGEEAIPPQDGDPFRSSTATRRSPSVAVRLEQSAGRQPMPVVHELGQNRIGGVTPEPIFEGQSTGQDDLITPAPLSRPVHFGRDIPPLNAGRQPAIGVLSEEKNSFRRVNLEEFFPMSEPSRISWRSQYVPSRLQWTAGRRGTPPFEHDIWRNHGTIPEFLDGDQTLGYDSITPGQKARSIRTNHVLQLDNFEMGRGRGMNWKGLADDPHPGFGLRPRGHGVRLKTKTTAPFESSFGQQRQPNLLFNPVASVPERNTKAPEKSVQEQIAALNSAVVSLMAQLNNRQSLESNFSLPSSVQIDENRQKWRHAREKIFGDGRVAIQCAGKSRNTGQRGSINKSRQSCRFTEDGSPVCNYCAIVGHKYRDCPKRKCDEMAKCRGASSNVDPCFRRRRVTHWRESTSQQLSIQLSALEKEVRKLRMPSLYQANCAIISDLNVDDSVVRRLLQPECTDSDECLLESETEALPASEILAGSRILSTKSWMARKDEGTIVARELEEKNFNTLSEELNMDDSVITTQMADDDFKKFDDLELDVSSIQEQTTISGSNDDQQRKFFTLAPGEQVTLKTSEVSSEAEGPKSKSLNARPSKPIIWSALLTIMLFTSFCPQVEAKRTSTAVSDFRLSHTLVSLGLKHLLFGPDDVQIPQQRSAQLTSLPEEMIDVSVVTLSSQVNSVPVSELGMDDSVISMGTPEEMTSDDRILPSHTLAAHLKERDTEVNGILKELPRNSRLHTAGEQKFVETPVLFGVSDRSQFRQCGVRPRKPSFWASFLTSILLFINFWSHGLVDRTFA